MALRKPIILAAALAFAGAVPLASASANPGNASAIAVNKLVQTGELRGGVEKVQHRYNKRRHGNRHRRRHRGHNHYHNGWWYAIPWWLGATLATPDRRPRTSRHVRWCDNRYRSYNPRTDQFLGYDGQYHYCRSPYRR